MTSKTASFIIGLLILSGALAWNQVKLGKRIDALELEVKTLKVAQESSGTGPTVAYATSLKERVDDARVRLAKCKDIADKPAAMACVEGLQGDLAVLRVEIDAETDKWK